MLNRRDAMIRLGQVGLSALTLPALLRARHAAAQTFAGAGTPLGPSLVTGQAAQRADGRAKACILVYLWGGPPQQDMWDLKPQAPEGIRSLFSPIDTVVPGIQVCDQMPQVAQHTDKLAIVRSLTHDSNVHEASVYHTLTGRAEPTLVLPRNQRNRTNYPGVGSVVAYFSEQRGLPATVTIPRPIGHDGVTYAGTHAGFLGPRYDPLELQAPAEVNGPPPHALDLPEGVDDARLRARLGLLNILEHNDRALEAGRRTRDLDDFRAQALAMLTSPDALGAFDLESEDPRLRDRYGRTEWGEAFLLARRLVESGVRLVTFTWYYICPDGNVANVWDNHGGTGSLGGITGFEMLRQPYCLPSLDQGLSALLEDMSATGLLDETLIAIYGEFGRTPQINATGGRDHWGMCQSAVFAGGGIRGGQVYGSSDGHAAYPKDHPVSPADLLATIYHAMGIAPEAEIYDQAQRPHRVAEGQPIVELF